MSMIVLMLAGLYVGGIVWTAIIIAHALCKYQRSDDPWLPDILLAIYYSLCWPKFCWDLWKKRR